MELNQQQSLNILIKAAQVAQSKGAFTLDDAEIVNKAIKTFVPKDKQNTESQVLQDNVKEPEEKEPEEKEPEEKEPEEKEPEENIADNKK